MNHSPRNVNTRNVLLALAALVLVGCCAVAARGNDKDRASDHLPVCS